MTGVSTTLLYGLRISSDFPLHQDRPWRRGGPADVDIRIGDPIELTLERPPGALLLDLEVDRPYFSGSRTPEGGYLLRFYRTCDFVIDPELSQVTTRFVSGADPEVAGVLAAGTLLSFILAMREHAVLHASAVQVGGAAVAFVGASGMGKSTMATLMCAEGASLITDDVLRLDLPADGAPPTCYLGASELRLRKAAGELAARFDYVPARRQTGDARDALTMPVSTQNGLPLAAIVVPLPDHERAKAEFTRMGEMEALLTLLRFPRVLGWQDQAVLGRQFQQLGEIVNRVPVYWGKLPWGPPFPADIGAQVLAAVDMKTGALYSSPVAL